MTSATITLYELLVEAGIDKDKARGISEEFITRADAQHFATKADIANLRSNLERFLFTALVTQAVFIIGMVITLIQLLN